MTIPEETITRVINQMLTSTPGDALHQICLVAAPRTAIGPLGLADPEQLQTTVYAIVVDDSVNPVEFITDTIGRAALACHDAGQVALFAALSQEVWMVKGMDELGTRLHRERRLHEHPNAQEVTMVYAACRDGRRWRAKRFLTGPEVEPTTDVRLLLGPPRPHEAFDAPWGRPLRALVGQRD